MSLASPSSYAYSNVGARSQIVSEVKPNPIESEIIDDYRCPANFNPRALDSQDFQNSDRRGMDHSPIDDRRFTHHSEIVNSDRDEEDHSQHQFEGSDHSVEVQDSELLDLESDKKQHHGLFSNMNSGEKNVDFDTKRRMKEDLEHLLGGVWATRVGIGSLGYDQTRAWKEALEDIIAHKNHTIQQLEKKNAVLESQNTRLKVTELEKGSHITQLETQLTIAMQENENKMSRISTLEKQNRNLQMEVGQLRSVHKGESLDAVDPIPGTIRRSDRLAPRNQPTKAGSSGV
jgi:hypothetical protein